ncbi:transposable element Tcb2 transposase [Trichonephila clavata]|uniref:Transposable element Tcb2 transposase n=1 Tax=Trichonephila clavata TaxID=2740835 RepID=A0A8X6FHF8_TRICU|nr:transposable element Tcb2 transposase [Trichonephila clavata]
MEKAAEQIYPVVELRKKSTCFCKRVEALVIPRISGALVRGVDKHVAQFMFQRNLQLADSCRGDETSSIDVLLGSDLFWECILPERISIEKGLFAINSVFGWVVVGANLLRHGEQNCSLNTVVMKNVAVMNDLKLFGELDSIGINNECENLSLSNKNFIDNFENNLPIGGRQLLRKIINKCLACKKYSVKSADQLSGQLPCDRISESPPFTVIGVDFTGPVYVKLVNDTEKSYIALFTCAVTRAVHIELVTGLSTRKFILALRRFLSRRSNCKTIYSDNASTFKCANKEIQYFFNIIKDEDFKNFISAEVGHKNDYPFNFSELLNNSMTRESFLKRKYYQTKLLSQFWKKWKDNYLLNTRSFHHFPKPSVERNLRVGDVVILEGNTKSKFLWDLGRIAKVMQGRDGLVRSCVVKTKKGEFKRPVPLELSET